MSKTDKIRCIIATGVIFLGTVGFALLVQAFQTNPCQ